MEKRPRRKKIPPKRRGLFDVVMVAVLGVLIALLDVLDKAFSAVSDKGRRYLPILGGAAVLSLAAVVIGIVVMRSGRVNAQKVFLDGALIGVIDDINISAKELEERAVLKLVTDEGADVKVAGTVTLEKFHNKDKTEDTEYVVGKLYRSFPFKVLAAVLSIDGSDIITLKSSEEVQEVLNTLRDEYVQDGLNIIETTFIEDVKIFERYVEKTDISTKEKALYTLTAEKAETVPYIVKSGDSVWQICQNTGLSDEDIYKLNPELNADPTKLRIGQEIKISRNLPMLSVVTRERREYMDVIPMSRETRTNDEYPRTYSKVLQQGRDGQKKILEDIIRENGFEVRREITQVIEVTPAVTEIIEVGTK